jgi:hypothetical protein
MFLGHLTMFLDVNCISLAQSYLVVYEFALILYKFDIFYSVFYKVVT